MKKIYAMLLICCLCWSFIFTPTYALQMDSWAKPAYTNLVEKNILPEVLANKENFKEPITRQEFTHLVMSYVLSNKKYDLDGLHSHFNDINDKDTYVNLATNFKVVSGYTDGSFRPHSPIKRSEAAVIAYRAEKLLGPPKKGSIREFKDAAFIPNWAKDAVASMVSKKAISGYPNGTFGPDKNITRQESIIMVYRLMQDSALLKSSPTDLFISDSYLKKHQYDFILGNLPTDKYTISSVKEKIISTPNKKRQSQYTLFKKENPPTKTTLLLTSPKLIFEDHGVIYVLGIEKRLLADDKKEQRVFVIRSSEGKKKAVPDRKKEYSAWFTVEK